MDIHKKFFSKIGFNYLILGIITLIFQIIILNIINLTNPQYLTDINIISIVSTICNYILPFPIFYWLMKNISSTKLEKTGIGNTIEEAQLQLTATKDGGTSKPVEVFNGQRRLRLTGITQSGRQIRLESMPALTAELSQPVTTSISVKPCIWLLWLGAVLVCVGTMWAAKQK